MPPSRYLVCEGPCSPLTREFDANRKDYNPDNSPPGMVARIIELGRRLVHTWHRASGLVSSGSRVEMVCKTCGKTRWN